MTKKDKVLIDGLRNLARAVADIAAAHAAIMQTVFPAFISNILSLVPKIVYHKTCYATQPRLGQA